MNESRRKEIENLIERLEVINSQVFQIRVADAVAKNERDPILGYVHGGLEVALRDLKRTLL